MIDAGIIVGNPETGSKFIQISKQNTFFVFELALRFVVSLSGL